MNEELQGKIQQILQQPTNIGEMESPDAVGTVGSAECGEMLRMWVKFRDERGKKVIDKASFQSFGCETAIAIASLATELIRGKTPEEALAMRGPELAGELGPLPPMKIHCAELVEGALRSALGGGVDKNNSSTPQAQSSIPTPMLGSGTLIESMASALNQNSKPPRKIVLIDP